MYLLIELLQEFGYRKMAEIGVCKSRVIRKLLRSPVGGLLEEYIAIDNWPETNRKSESKYAYAIQLMKYYPQLRVIRGDSVESAKLFDPGHFDLVFIDADHSYEGVKRDINAWLPLVRNGGILCGHDFFDGPLARHPGVARAVTELLGCNIEVSSTVWIHKVC
jgi:hypothetical protein